MALFGAPIAHEDHAVRACYVALAMQEAMRRYSAEVRRTHGVEVQILVGLNSGEVVVRAIGNGLHMDYSAISQTTHLAARMEQLANPGSIRLTAETLQLLGDLAAQEPAVQGEAAASYYAQALALAEELGMRPLQAHCHRGLGTLYAQTGQRQQARTALASAIDLYRDMEMTFWLPQAEAALGQVESAP